MMGVLFCWDVDMSSRERSLSMTSSFVLDFLYTWCLFLPFLFLLFAVPVYRLPFFGSTA
jgi:hypothetical protein